MHPIEANHTAEAVGRDLDSGSHLRACSKIHACAWSYGYQSRGGVLLQEPNSLVSQPLPWAADTALSVLVNQWATFAELAGPQRKRAEADAKRLKRLLGGHRSTSNKDALEAAQLLLDLLQSFGPPEPRQSDPAAEGTSAPATSLALGPILPCFATSFRPC